MQVLLGVPAGRVSASFNLLFSLTAGIIKKVLEITINKKKKHKIVMLARSNLNSIESLISQVLTDLEINHEEFKTIVNEKEKYEKMKDLLKIKKKLKQQNYKWK